MPASPSTARAINDRSALELLRQQGPLTAGQLKQLTGLSRPTIAGLVERLQESGLITVVGEAGAERRGPNARLYGIVADRAQLAALDVRTEGLSAVVADLLGTVLAEKSLPIDDDTGTEPAVQHAVALLEAAVAESGAGRLHSVGIGAPGLVDPATGQLRDTTGLPAWHRRLVDVLRERLPAAVVVQNETNLAAVAEQRVGAVQDRDTFVMLWLGHGIGAAVMLDGSLRRGAGGGAGEIGFLPVPGAIGMPSASSCDGGFHSLVGAAAVCALAAEYGIEAGAGDEAAAVAAVGQAASAPGERRYAAYLDALADRLAIGVASVAAILDPGCVLLGGAIGRAGAAALADRVERRAAALSPLRTEVRAGALGGTAVLRGALLTAQDMAHNDLFAPGKP
ncbi:N-acetylglucosamine repressor [Streptomyces sp. YIM 130001]|uniref:ROK family transcriptional regulator n=1 Tax=Streptomyces sp. YIM 130001 TaxID=2259644 RepID=UPI000E655E7C|nr:ROK family transcriptional regulator [Streptomyces sp. YIM 130001]RII19409.1 N-acetylglucosamine repressor [Streptomyces sp. YIM 130001]